MLLTLVGQSYLFAFLLANEKQQTMPTLILPAVFVFIMMKRVTIHCFVFFREIIHHLLSSIRQFIATWFYLCKDYSFSHSLSAVSSLPHNGRSRAGRYLVMVASVYLSICLSVCVDRLL